MAVGAATFNRSLRAISVDRLSCLVNVNNARFSRQNNQYKNMTTITQCLMYPNGTPVDGLLVKLDKVWGPPKLLAGKFGPTSVQNISLVDVAGSKIRCSVWGHADLTSITGQDVALQSVNGKGIKVVHKPWTDKNGAAQPGIELEISKDVVFKTATMSSGATTSVLVPQTAIAANPSPSGHVFGATVGMALNNAVLSLNAQGLPITKRALWELASLIITVSKQLEAGNLHSDKPQPVPQAPAPVPEADPSEDSQSEDGVPF